MLDRKNNMRNYFFQLIFDKDPNLYNRAPNADLGDVLVGGGGEAWVHFGTPESILLTATGDLIICDSGYHRIERWSPKTNSTVSLINNVDCSQLFTDQNGDLLFSTSRSMLYKWLPAENRTQLVMKPAGKILPSKAKGNRMFLSRNGDVYVADVANDRILKYTTGQNDAEIIAGGQTWQSSDLTHLDSPVSVIVDDKGTLYIGDAGSSQVVRWDVADSAGVVLTKQEKVGSNLIVRFDRSGNLYASSYTSIVRYDIDTSACSKLFKILIFTRSYSNRHLFLIQ